VSRQTQLGVAKIPAVDRGIAQRREVGDGSLAESVCLEVRCPFAAAVDLEQPEAGEQSPEHQREQVEACLEQG
jgi:hypothetical protein